MYNLFNFKSMSLIIKFWTISGLNILKTYNVKTIGYIFSISDIGVLK